MGTRITFEINGDWLDGKKKKETEWKKEVRG